MINGSVLLKMLRKSCSFIWSVAKSYPLTTISFGIGVVTAGYGFHQQPPNQVFRQFTKPIAPPLIREGFHLPRKELKKKIRSRFFGKKDSLGLVGVIFGPAGTGKSNVVRDVCAKEQKENKTTKEHLDLADSEKEQKENKTTKEHLDLADSEKQPKRQGEPGVVYMEVGSSGLFAYNLAKSCGIPVEPNIFDTLIQFFWPEYKVGFKLPDDERNALAYVFPIIIKGCEMYKKKHGNHVPVLFIDGADIIANQNEQLYQDLIEWAKKCTNDDSLQIVLVSSDSHLLKKLTRQAFKSRLGDLIEIEDLEDKEVMELLTKKFGMTEIFATKMYKSLDGRLSDLHKAYSIWDEEEESKDKDNNALKKIENQFAKEAKQAVSKAIGNSKDVELKIKLSIMKSVQEEEKCVEDNTSAIDMQWKIVEELKEDNVTMDQVNNCMMNFIDNNVLRITKELQLRSYSKMVKAEMKDRAEQIEKIVKLQAAQIEKQRAAQRVDKCKLM